MLVSIPVSLNDSVTLLILEVSIMKKRFCLLLLLISIFLAACTTPNFPNLGAESEDYQRFREVFFDVFDTVTILIAYTNSKEEFDYLSKEIIHKELYRLHQLFDIFNEYEGINNIRTINNYAGIAPVEVDSAIIDLLLLSTEAYHLSNGLLNVTIGPVTDIWRLSISQNVVPSMESLQAANEFTNINSLLINEEAGTVFLKKEGMSLDVGSIAKGFAIEYVAQMAMAAGFYSFSLTVGGDVRVGNEPLSHQDSWNIGVASPDGKEMLEVIHATNTSVFSSGDYLRYFIVEDERFHHIIDPRTLMPATKHRTVTVLYPDAAMADILSLAAFILDTDEAIKFLESFGAEGILMRQDGTIVNTSN